MERKPKSDSWRRAVQTTQNIIKSKTGTAIVKQAYRTADKQVDKKARLIDHRKGKELRKLAHEKVRFINEQDEKLKRKEPLKTQARNDVGAQKVFAQKNLEIRSPSEKDFAEDENCDGNLATVRSPNIAKSSIRREKCKTVCSTKEDSEQIYPTKFEEYELEYTENGKKVLPVRTIREFNEEARRGRLPESDIEVQTTNFYQDYDHITSWLDAVERKNLGHFQRTPRSERKKHKKVQNGEVQLQRKENAKMNASKSTKDDKGFLELPKISGNNAESPISCRTKSVKRIQSLDDPRFTELLDTLTPVNNTTLKLPKIPRSVENKSRAS